MRSRWKAVLDTAGTCACSVESSIGDAVLEPINHLVRVGKKEQSRFLAQALQEAPFVIVGVLELVTNHHRPSGLDQVRDRPRRLQQAQGAVNVSVGSENDQSISQHQSIEIHH